jgi:hypothetical protein
VSQENVELVMAFQPGPDVDLVAQFRDDDSWAVFSAALAPYFIPDFESANALLGIEKLYIGMSGFRTLWLDWLAPWTTHRVEIEEAMDLGERVLVAARALATLQTSKTEVSLNTGSIWTVRDRKVARVEFYPDRHEALKALGLEE